MANFREEMNAVYENKIKCILKMIFEKKSFTLEQQEEFLKEDQNLNFIVETLKSIELSRLKPTFFNYSEANYIDKLYDHAHYKIRDFVKRRRFLTDPAKPLSKLAVFDERYPYTYILADSILETMNFENKHPLLMHTLFTAYGISLCLFGYAIVFSAWAIPLFMFLPFIPTMIGVVSTLLLTSLAFSLTVVGMSAYYHIDKVRELKSLSQKGLDPANDNDPAVESSPMKVNQELFNLVGIDTWREVAGEGAVPITVEVKYPMPQDPPAYSSVAPSS